MGCRLCGRAGSSAGVLLVTPSGGGVTNSRNDGNRVEVVARMAAEVTPGACIDQQSGSSPNSCRATLRQLFGRLSDSSIGRPSAAGSHTQSIRIRAINMRARWATSSLTHFQESGVVLCQSGKRFCEDVGHRMLEAPEITPEQLRVRARIPSRLRGQARSSTSVLPRPEAGTQ